MADGISADLAELRRLAEDLGQVVVNAGPYVNSAVQVTSGKIKKDAQESVQKGGKRWRRGAAAIDYEVKVLRGFGGSVIESDIGYDKDKVLPTKHARAKSGTAGNIGNLREFGAPNSPPHNDLLNALEKNQADFADGLDKALQEAERVLTGGSTVSSAARSVIRGRLE